MNDSYKIYASKDYVEEVTSDVVRFASQELTESQQAQVRKNIGALELSDIVDELPEVTETNNGQFLRVMDGAWTAAESDAVTAEDVGLGNVENVKQYSASNPPPYPVTSVNGLTGDIEIDTIPDYSADDNGKFLGVANGAIGFTNIEAITIEEIDAICGSSIVSANEVKY